VSTPNTKYLRTWNTPVISLLFRRGEESLPLLLSQSARPLLVLLSNLPAGMPFLVPRISPSEAVRRLPVLLDY
jgi:hypothetical protein